MIVEKESYLLELSRYIHLNAVRAKVIERPEEYHWSSLRRYVGLSSKPDFVYTKDILAYFNYEGSKYLQFVYEGIEKEINLQPIDGMFLGSRKFVEKIKGHLYQRNDLSNLKQIQQPLSMEQIISKISQHYKILPNELNNRNRRPNFSECRKMIIYVVRAKTSLSLKEIGQRMGSIGPQAVNNIIKKIELSPDLKKKANEFLGKV